LPELDEGALWLQVQMPTGLSLDEASGMADKLRQKILEYPEVSYVVTQLGRSDAGSDPWTPSHMEVPVGLKPYNQWPSGESKGDFVNRLNKSFSQMPGFSIGISQPIVDGINDSVGGAHSPLALRIYSSDLKQARKIGDQIVAILRTIRGTAYASIFQEPPIPQVVIKADREKAARFGINISDIALLISTGLGGDPVTPVYIGDRIYNVTVRFPKESKR